MREDLACEIHPSLANRLPRFTEAWKSVECPLGILSIASRAKMTQGTLAQGVAGVAMSCQSRWHSGIPHVCIRNMWSACSAVTSHLERGTYFLKNNILIITKIKINKAFKDIYVKEWEQTPKYVQSRQQIRSIPPVSGRCCQWHTYYSKTSIISLVLRRCIRQPPTVSASTLNVYRVPCHCSLTNVV